MEIRIFWTDFSKSKLQEIFNYHKEVANLRIARKLVSGIIQEVTTLQKQPNIGQREEYLIDRDQEFRYIIYKNYKLIYWHNIPKHRIEIIDVFDTRQNPLKIQGTL